ncbi:MAG: hypothetical protein ACE5NJ_07095 [Thermodesulfobacteriota bacterium]
MKEKGVATTVVAIIVIVIVAVAGVSGYLLLLKSGPTESSPGAEGENQEGEKPGQFTVIEENLLFTGGYTDPSVIQMPDGTYLMYLNRRAREGENWSGSFVLSSGDGIFWNEETGIVFLGVAVGRAFRFPNGVRYYYHQPPREKENRGTIVSSFSTDGITNWTYEGVRIRPREGHAVAGPGVVRLKDGTYRMFFFEKELIDTDPRRATSREIYGASSKDGLSWRRDEAPTIVYEENVEGAGLPHPQRGQVLHPFVIEWPEQNGYLMLYNSHSRIFAAYSQDGFNWEKLGYTGIVGADADAIRLPDGSFRIYFGDFSPETLGVVYTAILKVE